MSDDRQALIERVALDIWEETYPGVPFDDSVNKHWYYDEATRRVDGILADPVRLLRVIAAQTEPCPNPRCKRGRVKKLVDMSGGVMHRKWTDNADTVLVLCDTCGGSGRVPVDVLSLLQTAGVIEQVVTEWRVAGEENWLRSPQPRWVQALSEGQVETRPVYVLVAARRGGTS